jgi:hypothetical protein
VITIDSAERALKYLTAEVEGIIEKGTLKRGGVTNLETRRVISRAHNVMRPRTVNGQSDPGR